MALFFYAEQRGCERMSKAAENSLPEDLPEKRIEVLTMRVGDIITGFGNPRKIGKFFN